MLELRRQATLAAPAPHTDASDDRGDDDRNAGENEEIEDKENDLIIKQIKEVLDTKIKPAVSKDGGDIKFVSFKDGTVNVELRGSCSGCPSSVMTLKNGVQNLLRHYVKEVNNVEAK